jgi:hypothetical protein
MANVKDVVKEVIPVVAEIVTDYLSKGEEKEEEKQNVMTAEEIRKEVDDDAVRQVGKYAGCKLADALDAEEINKYMNEQEYSDCDKIRESYCNGIATGFRLGVNTANHVHSVASDALKCTGTLLGALEDVAKNDLKFISEALEPKEISDKED